MMRAAIYTRVSTDDQTVDNQTLELRALAERRGWNVVKEYADEGISGAKGRMQRPGLDAMLTGASKHQFDVVIAWAVDRLGRSVEDLYHTMNSLRLAEVKLYTRDGEIDTTTSMGELMFGLLAVIARFENKLKSERVRSGMARMKSEGRRAGPKSLDEADPKRYAIVKGRLLAGEPPWRIHKSTGTGHSTVLKLRDQLVAEGLLQAKEHESASS